MARSFVQKVQGKVKLWLSQRLARSPLVVPPSYCAVSFSFDDFPRTALDAATALEQHGVRGTFYTCFDMLSKDSPSGVCASLDDVKMLAHAGHEIAGHTYAHENCAHTAARDIAASCRKNAEVAAEHGLTFTNFAYPQGGISLGSKKFMRDNFNSARGITSGINRGLCDAAALLGTRVYETSDFEALKAMVDDAVAHGGWIVFYTHDVTSNPSQYGVSLDRFKELLAYTVAQGAAVKTVDHVMRELS